MTLKAQYSFSPFGRGVLDAARQGFCAVESKKGARWADGYDRTAPPTDPTLEGPLLMPADLIYSI
jgi:hypothetical protein